LRPPVSRAKGCFRQCEAIGIVLKDHAARESQGLTEGLPKVDILEKGDAPLAHFLQNRVDGSRQADPDAPDPVHADLALPQQILNEGSQLAKEALKTSSLLGGDSFFD
jgi:hypothetical protein